MSDSNSTVFKFCNKCKCETERYKCGACKPCTKLSNSIDRAENKEKYRKYLLDWKEANKERVKANDAKRYAAKKEAIKEKMAIYYAENSVAIRSRVKEWISNNHHLVKIYSHNRRAREKASGHKLSTGLQEKLLVLQKCKCACCGKPLGKSFHLDHIMPLALGGPNNDENIQLLRDVCNLQKSAKHPIDFMQSRGFLL
jgi:hypothetical protein